MKAPVAAPARATPRGTRPRHEPTQPGNPHRLTVHQHVFPRSAIERFVDGAGFVEVERFAGGAPFKVRPDNDLFCARSAWDQATETFRTHDTEAAYAQLADRVAGGRVESLSAEMDGVVSAFYSLWRHRQAARLAPVPDARLNMVQAERVLDKQAEEVLEVKGAMFIGGDSLPSRFMTGMTILRSMDAHLPSLRGLHWGVLRAQQAHFLVPDGPGELCALPVSPTICLCINMPDVTLDPLQVADVNRQLLANAANYFFAQDLQRCPILRRTLPLA